MAPSLRHTHAPEISLRVHVGHSRDTYEAHMGNRGVHSQGTSVGAPCVPVVRAHFMLVLPYLPETLLRKRVNGRISGRIRGRAKTHVNGRARPMEALVGTLMRDLMGTLMKALVNGLRLWPC